MLDHNKAMEICENVTIDDFAKKIKTFPSFNTYMKHIKESDSAHFLQATTMMIGMFDDEFRFMMNHVAYELLFGMIDAKFKEEFLEKEENVCANSKAE